MKTISYIISLLSGALAYYLGVFLEGLFFMVLGWASAIFYAAGDIENFYNTIKREEE